jgi:hypothetical protein
MGFPALMLFSFFAGMPIWVKTSTIPDFAGLRSNVAME